MIELNKLVERITPSKTILFFGSGSSIPSGLKSAAQLRDQVCSKFNLEAEFSLSEATQIIEDRESRATLISFLRSEIQSAKPAGGIVNLPMYNWNALYTTNYDTIIEQTYQARNLKLQTLSSNFDFGQGRDDNSTKLFKLHGTIDRDVVDGHLSRMILTEGDYDLTSEYREMLWTRLSSDLSDNDCIFIGYSLADPHVRDLVTKIANLKLAANHTTRVYLLLYSPEPDRAALIERKNVEVCFGSVDDFFATLSTRENLEAVTTASPDALFEGLDALYPSTVFVDQALKIPPALSRMYQGWPATWADVETGLTFPRDRSADAANVLESGESTFAMFVGASGTGKTTAARQTALELVRAGYMGWEHNTDRQLLVKEWYDVAERMNVDGRRGVLFIDDAQDHLYEVNKLVDALTASDIGNLQIILAAPRHDWNPRVKSSNLYRFGTEFHFSQLSDREIGSLVKLVESQPDVRALVERNFGNFSRSEKLRRLQQHCSRNTFVCLRNIFDSDAFDDIILREFASLQPNCQNIYRIVSALESLNVKVHRQLVMRITSIPPSDIAALLGGLTDIVEEYTVDERQGVYGWRGRHRVITEIIAKYKFNQQGEIYKLLEQVIESLSMTYDIEVRTVRNLCSGSGGLQKAGNKQQQNNLLQKLISHAPGERVPRHRLIANLISMGESAKAETEIKLFETDFHEDGPVARYRVKLLMFRALKAKGIMEEDRKAIIAEAVTLARRNVKRFGGNKHVLSSYCEVGLANLKLTGSFAVYDEALDLLKRAEGELGDPDISRQIEKFSQALSDQGEFFGQFEVIDEEVVTD